MSKVSTGKVLGELEKEIMEIIWQQGERVSVREVKDILQRKRKIAYTTVMTIMSRLVEKGILQRRLKGISYLYYPKLTKDKFIAKAVHKVFSSTVSNLGEGAFAHFIKEIKRLEPKKRRKLLKILEEK